MTSLDLSNKNKYDSLLLYVFQQCDEVSFHFPVLDKETYSIGELAAEYVRYEDEKQEFLDELFKHGATQEKARVYQGMKFGYETQIIRSRLYPKLIEKFKKHHLYDWLWWNALPEDPCFFSKKFCRFITVSHEELFYVCDQKRDSLLIQQFRD